MGRRLTVIRPGPDESPDPLKSKERPMSVAYTTIARPATRRRPFGQGLLRSLPSYRAPFTMDDARWWAEQNAIEEDREVERMYQAFRAQERMDSGFQPW
jgi:hypothetical protein